MHLIPKLSLLFVTFTGAVLGGCVSTKERFADDIGCKLEDTTLTNVVKAPAYTATTGTCKNEAYTCRRAPFWKSCKRTSEWEKSK